MKQHFLLNSSKQKHNTLTMDVQQSLGFINIKIFGFCLINEKAEDDKHNAQQVSILCKQLHISLEKDN